MDKFSKLFGDPNARRPLKPGAGIALGVAIGLSIGVAMKNMAVGLALGAAIGVAFENASKRKGQPPRDRSNP